MKISSLFYLSILGVVLEESCGIGIRENSKRITDNISNFVSYIISNE